MIFNIKRNLIEIYIKTSIKFIIKTTKYLEKINFKIKISGLKKK